MVASRLFSVAAAGSAAALAPKVTVVAPVPADAIEAEGHRKGTAIGPIGPVSATRLDGAGRPIVMPEAPRTTSSCDSEGKKNFQRQ